MNLLIVTTSSLFVQLLCNITFKNLTLSLFPSLKVVLERFILTQKIYEILRAAFVSNYYCFFRFFFLINFAETKWKKDSPRSRIQRAFSHFKNPLVKFIYVMLYEGIGIHFPMYKSTNWCFPYWWAPHPTWTSFVFVWMIML